MQSVNEITKLLRCSMENVSDHKAEDLSDVSISLPGTGALANINSAGAKNASIKLLSSLQLMINLCSKSDRAIKVHEPHWRIFYCSIQQVLYDNNVCTADDALLKGNEITSEVDKAVEEHCKPRTSIDLYRNNRDSIGRILKSELNINHGDLWIVRLFKSMESECSLNENLQFAKPPATAKRLHEALLAELTKKASDDDRKLLNEHKIRLIVLLLVFTGIPDNGNVLNCSLVDKMRRTLSVFLPAADLHEIAENSVKMDTLSQQYNEFPKSSIVLEHIWLQIEDLYGRICSCLGWQKSLLLQDLSSLGLWSCKSTPVSARAILLSKYLQSELACSYSLPFLASDNRIERFLSNDPEMAKAVLHRIMLNTYENNGIGKVGCVQCIKKQIPFSLILATLLGYINIAGMIGLICTGF